MKQDQAVGVDELIQCLNAAVELDRVEAITSRIKEKLEGLVRDARLCLPQDFRRCCAGGYARRLLHRDRQRGYTVVVMTWGPNQKTELHDHAGMWCVECVVEGEIEISQYDVLDRTDERWRFDRRSSMR